jgi:pimeloyl-ACP methyl ester carboxylesterase
MGKDARGLRSRLREWLRLRAGRFGPLERLALADRDQWQALAAYRGLVHQAFAARPLAPQVSSDLWELGDFHSSAQRRPFFSPAQREREPSSHHYGHDVQLKRHAGLPLIGQPLPWLLEHGLKVSATATFDRPRSWSRGYLCMGPLRAHWLRQRFALPAVPIGPWISYARPLLGAAEMARLRDALGPILLVVLAHSWDQVERCMDLDACIAAVSATAAAAGYRQVIWLRHWKDPQPEGLPPEWILACNGHRSNPWFLDAMRTLLELSDGLVSNAFGTHLGYAVALGKRLHWIAVGVDQDLSGLAGPKAEEEREEWRERERLSGELVERLAVGGEAGEGAVLELLNPYWGFDAVCAPGELREVLLGGRRSVGSVEELGH